MDNKNLDRLFQENLKNLEATPNKRVWNSIEAKLTNKKRKVIPFWWFTSGIAALLVVTLFLYPFANDDDKVKIKDTDIIISNAPKENKEKVIIPKSDSIIPHKSHTKQVLIANDKPIDNKQNTSKNEQLKKKVVSSKNAMKKIFLAYDSHTQNLSSEKEQKKVSKNTVVEKSIKEKEIRKSLNKEKKVLKKVDIFSVSAKKDSISNKPKKNKWSVAPVLGVLNSNSFSDASPIQKNLSNSTIGQNSLSIGLQVGYRIHKKWTIQTGIHKQEISYAHNKINVVASLPSSNSSISLDERSSVSFESLSEQRTANINADVSLNSINLNGDLDQTFGYIEIPIEIKYHFLSTKNFESQIVAGFSSLFLNKNEVNFSTQFQTELGRTNNLNSINFSGNIGLDFNYLVTKKWSINLNPMFKAQLNTFNNNANGFAPFNLGVYTGIKYRF